jgi:hypothetical protein
MEHADLMKRLVRDFSAETMGRPGKLSRYAAAFAVDLVAVTVVTTPLWWLADGGRGAIGAVISGAVSGVLLGLFWRPFYRETVWMRIAKRLHPSRLARRKR